MSVDVILPQYGRIDLTEKCMATIREHSPDANVVLVHNGYTGEAFDEFSMPTCATYIEMRDNIGYGRASNVGAAASVADYLMFLNNDCEVHEGWLEPLVAAMDDPMVGAAAGRLEDPDGGLQHAGVHLFWDDNGVLTAQNITDEQPAGEADCLAGTALLVRRQAWLMVGGYDPGFWNGYEDVDLCLRLRVAGWKLWYCPDSTVMHHKHASGPSRWTRVNENIALLHNRWSDRVQPAEG